jgi:hypothetical protein
VTHLPLSDSVPLLANKTVGEDDWSIKDFTRLTFFSEDISDVEDAFCILPH